MRRKSIKVMETEKWVDKYISSNGFPPSYQEIMEKFGLKSKSVAYSRCEKFRHKMATQADLKGKEIEKATKITMTWIVPHSKIGVVTSLINKITEFLN